MTPEEKLKLRRELFNSMKSAAGIMDAYKDVLEKGVKRGFPAATLAGIEALLLFEERLLWEARDKLKKLRGGR